MPTAGDQCAVEVRRRPPAGAENPVILAVPDDLGEEVPGRTVVPGGGPELGPAREAVRAVGVGPERGQPHGRVVGLGRRQEFPAPRPDLGVGIVSPFRQGGNRQPSQAAEFPGRTVPVAIRLVAEPADQRPGVGRMFRRDGQRTRGWQVGRRGDDHEHPGDTRGEPGHGRPRGYFDAGRFVAAHSSHFLNAAARFWSAVTPPADRNRWV